MARSQTRTKREAAAQSQLSNVDLYYPVLAGCAFTRTPPPDGSEEADEINAAAGRFYDSAIHPLVEPMDADRFLAVCEFKAGKKVKDVNVVEVQATYIVGCGKLAFTHSDERKRFVEQLVGAAVWPIFRDLFIHIGSQSGEELPLLPNNPKLRWLSDDMPAAGN